MHQTTNYQGSQQAYVQLVQLANYFLSLHGIGDEPSCVNAHELMLQLGIDEEQALQLLDALMEQCQSLDDMIRQMAA